MSLDIHPTYFSQTPRPPGATLFPYTTLFRSLDGGKSERGERLFLTAEPLGGPGRLAFVFPGSGNHFPGMGDRKSTRLNSSHVAISYAVVCLKKKTSISTRASFRVRQSADHSA